MLFPETCQSLALLKAVKRPETLKEKLFEGFSLVHWWFESWSRYGGLIKAMLPHTQLLPVPEVRCDPGHLTFKGQVKEKVISDASLHGFEPKNG